MKSYNKINKDVTVIKDSVIAIIKTEEEVATKNGLEQKINMWTYLKGCQVPIVITANNREEADEIEAKLLGE